MPASTWNKLGFRPSLMTSRSRLARPLYFCLKACICMPILRAMSSTSFWRCSAMACSSRALSRSAMARSNALCWASKLFFTKASSASFIHGSIRARMRRYTSSGCKRRLGASRPFRGFHSSCSSSVSRYSSKGASNWSCSSEGCCPNSR